MANGLLLPPTRKFLLKPGFTIKKRHAACRVIEKNIHTVYGHRVSWTPERFEELRTIIAVTVLNQSDMMYRTDEWWYADLLLWVSRFTTRSLGIAMERVRDHGQPSTVAVANALRPERYDAILRYQNQGARPKGGVYCPPGCAAPEIRNWFRTHVPDCLRDDWAQLRDRVISEEDTIKELSYEELARLCGLDGFVL